MGRVVAVMAVAAAVLVGAASAQAALYAGQAGDGTRVSIRVKNDDGRPKRVEFGNYKARCTEGYGAVKNPIVGFVRPFDVGSAEEILDKGHRRFRQHMDGVGRVRVRASWHFKARHTGEDHWAGDYSTQGVFRKHGRIITRCTADFGFDIRRH